MPAEPENSIETQLKAYAEARRQAAGEPLALHPATRRMLQGEVARALGAGRRDTEAAGEPQHNVWTALWTRLAWAGGAAVVAALVLVVTLNKDGRVAMQMADAPNAAPMAAPAASTSTPAPEPERALDRDADLGARAEMLKAKGGAPVQPPVVRLDETQAERSLPVEPMKSAQAAQQPAALSVNGRADAPARAEPRAVEPFKTTKLAGTPAEAAPAPAMMPAEEQKQPARGPQAQSAARSPDPRGGMGGGGVAAGRDLAGAPAPDAAKVYALAPPMAPPPVSAAPAGAGEPARRSPAAPATQAARPANGIVEEAEALARLAGEKKTAAAEAGARFVQVTQADKYRRNFNSPRAPDVLNSFQFQYAGGRVTIVDADGSVYEGAVIAARDEEEAPLRDLKEAEGFRAPALREAERRQMRAADAEAATRARKAREAAEAARSGAVAPVRSVFFRVEGTNRSLGQVVVFSGSAQTLAPPAAGGLARQFENRDAMAKDKADEVPATRAILRIQGRAAIGQQSELPIDALPARR